MGETTNRVRLGQVQECLVCGACVAMTGADLEEGADGWAVLCLDCVEAGTAGLRLGELRDPTVPVPTIPTPTASVPGAGVSAARHADRRRWPAPDEPAGAGIPAQRRRVLPGTGEVDTMPPALLERVCGDDSVVLHGRRRGRTGRGEIDHLAVTGAGVHVIAVRRAYGDPVTVRRGRTRSVRDQRLLVGGRDETGVVDRLRAQVLEVAVALGPLVVPVHPLIWFIEGEPARAGRGSGPRRGRVLHVRDVPVVGTPGIGALLSRPGPVSPQRRRVIAAHLDRELPPA